MILDNLSTHKSPRAAEALRKHGCWVLFLPAYSPDLNPIEMAFSKLNAYLRRIGARTFDTLLPALVGWGSDGWLTVLTRISPIRQYVRKPLEAPLCRPETEWRARHRSAQSILLSREIPLSR